MFVGFYAIILPTFTFLFTSMCFTESIYQLKSEPKEMRRQKKRTKNKKNNLTLPLYAQFTQWINRTTFTGTLHFISFFISCNKSLSSMFLMTNSLSDFYVNFSYINTLLRIIKIVGIRKYFLLFAVLVAVSSVHDLRHKKKRKADNNLSIFRLFQFHS